MRFKEAYEGYQCKRLTQSEAASLLGVCDRSFRRYLHRYDEFGMDGLLDQRRNNPSHHLAPIDEVMALQDLYSSRYHGWNVLFHGRQLAVIPRPPRDRGCWCWMADR